MFKFLCLFLLVVSGVAYGQTSVLVHNIPTNAITTLPPNSCIYVDENLGGSNYIDTKLCNGWATAFGGLAAANNLADIPNPSIAYGNIGGGPLGKLNFPATSPLLGSSGSGFTNVNIGSGLSLSGGVLSATGGGGGAGNPAGASNSVQFNQTGAFGGTNVLGNAVLITASNGAPLEFTTLPPGLTIPGYLTGLNLTGAITGTGGPNITTSFSNAVDTAVLSNISGSLNPPTYNTLSALMDYVFGSTQGTTLCRGASNWAGLAPGSVGQFLQTQGAGANCRWATVAGTGNVVGAGVPTVNGVPRITGSFTLDFATYPVAQTAASNSIVETTAGGTIDPSMIPGTSNAILQGYISGLVISNDGVTPNTIIDISSGVATSDDNTTSMRLPSNFTKTTGAWTLGSSGGCLDTGAVAASVWYYVYEIERIDTSVVDLLCTRTFNGPTLPASYTKKRLVAEFATDGSSNIRRFYSHQNGTLYKWLVPTYQTSTATTARTLVVMDVPPNIIVQPICMVSVTNANPPVSLLIQSPADTDAAPDVNSPFGVSPGWDIYAQVSQQGGASNATCPEALETNITQQIATHATLAATTANFITRGWYQTR